MEPNDMTKEELRRHLLTCDGRGVAAKTAMLEELLAREADALRKENEELRKALSGAADEFHTLGNQNYYADPEFDPAGIASGAESMVRKSLAKESEASHDR